MLYDLIQTKKGKDIVVMTDTLPKVNDRMRTLRDSQRGKNVSFNIVPTENSTKFRKKLFDNWLKS